MSGISSMSPEMYKVLTSRCCITSANDEERKAIHKYLQNKRKQYKSSEKYYTNVVKQYNRERNSFDKKGVKYSQRKYTQDLSEDY